ncbi:fungal-specific transcription factor domain-containing protein [Aspergillus similis]
MERKSTACHNCRSIKALCTKQIPCARCKRLLLSCQYLDAGSSATKRPSNPLPNAATTKAKAKHTKSQSGCLTCQQRRKKCDEKQPKCSDCDRLRLPCVRPKDQVHSLEDSSPGSDMPGPSDQFLALDAFGQWAIADAPRPATQGPDSFQTETITHGNLAGSTALVNYPGAAVGSNAVGGFIPLTALNELVGVSPDKVASWAPVERHMLDHFLQSVARALVMVDNKANPLMRAVVPMAMENSMVKHAMIALSSGHLARIYPDFQKDLCVYRSKALQELMCNLETKSASLYAVVTTLLLTLTEICTGGSGKWILHLHGASALLTQEACNLNAPAGDSIVAIYNYLSCVTSVMSDRAPGQYRKPGPSNASLIDPLFGLSTSLFQSLVSLSRYSSRKPNRHITEPDPGDIRMIEVDVESWRPPEIYEETPAFAEARAMGYALQQAIIMRLLQITQKLKNNHPKMTKASEKILSALSLIRPGSNVECRMLFPLFMAGVGCMTKSHRLTIEYRLNVMETTIGFGCISLAHKILDEIWRKANHGQIVDWEDLMKSKYPWFVFL